MKLGLVIPFDGRPDRTMQDVRDVAVHAETAGIDSLWFPEHVVFFPSYTSKYPYTADGNPGFGKRAGVYDPLFAATVAAGATQRVRLGTAILIVPQRNPVVLAQEIVALDHASNGRFDFGIGVGWSSEEFAALGIPWARRGARTDDYLVAMKALWRDAYATHHGEFITFDDVIADPKPIQSPHPPIWVGGGGAAMKRAATGGDGWYGWALAPTGIASAMAELDRACEAAGRDPATVGRKIGLPIVGPIAEFGAYLDAAQAAGVTEVVVGVGTKAAQLHPAIDELAKVRS